MKTNAQKVSDFRRNRKQLLVAYCGNKCQLCGYDKSMRALNFHHIDETQKSYGITAQGTCHNIDRDIEEVHKTILLCANCHAEVHDGLYTKEELFKKQFFNEQVIEEYKKNREPKPKNKCKKCGKEISPNAEFCEICCKIQRRIVDRPSREELKKMIYEEPFTVIGKRYKVSDNTIRKWCDAYNLPRKKQEINQYSEEEWKLI